MSIAISGHGLSHWEHRRAAKAWLDLLDSAAGHGLGLQVSHDFSWLHEINARHRDTGWTRLVPCYDHTAQRITSDDGFWIGLSDPSGQILGTVACRLRHVTGSLKQRFEDMTFLVPDASERGAWAEVDAPDLGRIAGLIALPGAMWVHPYLRGKGLSRPLFAAAMVQAYARWKPDHVCGLVELETENSVGFGAYGFPRSHKFLVCHISPDEFAAAGKRLAVLTMTGQEMRERFIHLRDAA